VARSTVAFISLSNCPTLRSARCLISRQRRAQAARLCNADFGDVLDEAIGLARERRCAGFDASLPKHELGCFRRPALI
jgi:hypothetical protein